MREVCNDWGGGSNNQFWIHYLWEGLIEQFICDSFNWGELISDWLNIILCQTIIWNGFSFISPVPQTLCLSLLLSLTSPWREPTLFPSVLIDKKMTFWEFPKKLLFVRLKRPIVPLGNTTWWKRSTDSALVIGQKNWPKACGKNSFVFSNREILKY